MHNLRSPKIGLPQNRRQYRGSPSTSASSQASHFGIPLSPAPSNCFVRQARGDDQSARLKRNSDRQLLAVCSLSRQCSLSARAVDRDALARRDFPEKLLWAAGLSVFA
jgi:hypothetical protein